MFGNKDGWPAWHLLYNVIYQYTADRGDQRDRLRRRRRHLGVGGDHGSHRRRSSSGTRTATSSTDFNAIAQADASAGSVRARVLFSPAGSWEAATWGDNVGFFLTPPLEEGEPAGHRHLRLRAGTSPPTASSPPRRRPSWTGCPTRTAARDFFACGDIAPLAVDDPESRRARCSPDIYDAWTTVLDNDALLPYLDFSTPTAAEVITR